MKKLISTGILFASLFAVCTNATALTILDATEGVIAKLETTDNTIQNGEVTASVIWTYEIAEANMMEQRSTRGLYRINCAEGSLALAKWEMFSDAQGKGNLVWSDQADSNNIDFRQPNRQVERTMINASCQTKTAMNHN